MVSEEAIRMNLDINFIVSKKTFLLARTENNEWFLHRRLCRWHAVWGHCLFDSGLLTKAYFLFPRFCQLSIGGGPNEAMSTWGINKMNLRIYQTITANFDHWLESQNVSWINFRFLLLSKFFLLVFEQFSCMSEMRSIKKFTGDF